MLKNEDRCCCKPASSPTTSESPGPKMGFASLIPINTLSLHKLQLALQKPPTQLTLHNLLEPSRSQLASVPNSFPDMSGVWMFKQNGVIHLVGNLAAVGVGGGGRRKVLVHISTEEVVTSYAALERILRGLGWEWYYGGDGQDEFYQFHRKSSIDLISLPKGLCQV